MGEPPDSGFSADWPMSREEKKVQILRLYNKDVQTVDGMLRAGEASMQALRAEMDAIRRVIDAPMFDAMQRSREAAEYAEEWPAHELNSEAMRLRSAVESAAALLRAMQPVAEASKEDDAPAAASSDARPRARSEGARQALLSQNVKPIKPALCRTPRTSQGGAPRRVSFGQKQEHRFEDVVSSDSEDERAARGGRVSMRSAQQSRHSTGNTPQDVLEDANKIGAHSEQPALPQEQAVVMLDEPEPEGQDVLAGQVSGQTKTYEEGEVSDESEEEGEVADDLLEDDMEEGEVATFILPEMCAGSGVSKIGLSFKHLPPEELVVRKVVEGSWADEQGIRPGDLVVAVNGRRTEWLKGPQFMEMMGKRPLRLLVERSTHEDE